MGALGAEPEAGVAEAGVAALTGDAAPGAADLGVPLADAADGWALPLPGGQGGEGSHQPLGGSWYHNDLGGRGGPLGDPRRPRGDGRHSGDGQGTWVPFLLPAGSGRGGGSDNAGTSKGNAGQILPQVTGVVAKVGSGVMVTGTGRADLLEPLRAEGGAAVAGGPPGFAHPAAAADLAGDVAEGGEGAASFPQDTVTGSPRFRDHLVGDTAGPGRIQQESWLAQAGEAAPCIGADPVLAETPLLALIHIHTGSIDALKALGTRSIPLEQVGVAVAGLALMDPPGHAGPPAADILGAETGEGGAALSPAQLSEAVSVPGPLLTGGHPGAALRQDTVEGCRARGSGYWGGRGCWGGLIPPPHPFYLMDGDCGFGRVLHMDAHHGLGTILFLPIVGQG